jgi:hypothetical protein
MQITAVASIRMVAIGPSSLSQGYSIGKWVDEDGDGRYDVLEVETRGPFNGPRVYDAIGLPLHRDNQSIFKERIYLDKADPNTLHNEITVIDHALTRPWTVDKRFVRNTTLQPVWPKYVCSEHNERVAIGDVTQAPHLETRRHKRSFSKASLTLLKSA